MYSTMVMDRFLNPRRTGELLGATHYGVEGVPGDGPYAQIWLKLNEREVEDGSYETYPCPAAVACASLVVELAVGRTVEQAEAIEPTDIATILGGLPEGKEHCATRAIKTLRSAFASPRSN